MPYEREVAVRTLIVSDEVGRLSMELDVDAPEVNIPRRSRPPCDFRAWHHAQ